MTLPDRPKVSIILPAHNEAGYIEACLTAVLASTGITSEIEVIVVANACTDTTVHLAQGFEAAATARDWGFHVVGLEQGGKLNALNVGDDLASGATRLYLDADVLVSAGLIGQLIIALAPSAAAYASGTPTITKAQNWVTRAYARFWIKLPFVTQGVPGFGIFAVNAAGRARWQGFPDIISDDTFARLQFVPSERTRVSASYSWPMVEGFANLVRVRRRQNAGVEEIMRGYPQLKQNDDKAPVAGLLGRFFSDPMGFVVYGAVSLAVKTPLFASQNRWARGR